jgi:hypothetical protein
MLKDVTIAKGRISGKRRAVAPILHKVTVVANTPDPLAECALNVSVTF